MDSKEKKSSEISPTFRERLYHKSMSCVMVRSIDGSISFWNRAAESQYGWPTRKAVGAVSHELLQTVFPESLESINSQLSSEGVWHGELIHTCGDGRRVKVDSRWELKPLVESGPPLVVETNEVRAPVSPASAFLNNPHPLPTLISKALTHWRWWLLPFLLVIAGFEIMLLLTEAGMVVSR